MSHHVENGDSQWSAGSQTSALVVVQRQLFGNDTSCSLRVNRVYDFKSYEAQL